MAVSGTGLASVAGGFVLFWSGLKNASITDTLKSLLRGQLPAPHLTGGPTIGVAAGSAAPSSSSASSTAAAAAAGDTSSHSTAALLNQTLARGLATALGHPDWIAGAQWQAWLSLWNRESGWSNTADTRKTGLDPPDAAVFAYGIAQARPYSKMPRPGWPPDKSGVADPVSQMTWGIEYIAGDYGSPQAAWDHEQASGWY